LILNLYIFIVLKKYYSSMSKIFQINEHLIQQLVTFLQVLNLINN